MDGLRTIYATIEKCSVPKQLEHESIAFSSITLDEGLQALRQPPADAIPPDADAAAFLLLLCLVDLRPAAPVAGRVEQVTQEADHLRTPLGGRLEGDRLTVEDDPVALDP